MPNLLVLGAGKVGALIGALLASADSYDVYLADIAINTPALKALKEASPRIQWIALDGRDEEAVKNAVKDHHIKAIVSSLPYYCTLSVARAAKAMGVHYFDLVEDREVASEISKMAEGAEQVFATQCGLAPGFISIITRHLMRHFEGVDTVKMRVGALPVNASNALQYSLTWSTDGLINEYSRLCEAIVGGQPVQVNPLEGLEEIKIDGLTYEAFHTSGGAGSLLADQAGKVYTMDYKTIRYPGHCEKMRFLLHDLRLGNQRDLLKAILERALPKTYQDVVLVYVSVVGKHQGVLVEESYVRKCYPRKLFGFNWSAIQVMTAANICATVDLTFKNPDQYHGYLKQESIPLNVFLSNRFGRYYAPKTVRKVKTKTH